MRPTLAFSTKGTSSRLLGTLCKNNSVDQLRVSTVPPTCLTILIASKSTVVAKVVSMTLRTASQLAAQGSPSSGR